MYAGDLSFTHLTRHIATALLKWYWSCSPCLRWKFPLRAFEFCLRKAEEPPNIGMSYSEGLPGEPSVLGTIVVFRSLNPHKCQCISNNGFTDLDIFKELCRAGAFSVVTTSHWCRLFWCKAKFFPVTVVFCKMTSLAHRSFSLLEDLVITWLTFSDQGLSY